jgi:hypothetical protein
MTEKLTFDEWTDFMVNVCEKKVIKHHDDQVILVCGYEGTGKSTFSIATYCDVWKKRGLKPTNDMIFYEYLEYLKTNMHALITKSDKIPTEYMNKVLSHYKQDLDVINKALGERRGINEGDMLTFDEAGTQAFTRDAMSNENKGFAKLLQANRFLNLIHMLNVPSPYSIDHYIRKRRARMMILCDAEYTNNWEERIRYVYVYSKSQYLKIINSHKNDNAFDDVYSLIKKIKPDMEINVVDTNIPKLIPKDIKDMYDAKKIGYNIKQTWDMMEQLNPVKEKKNKIKREVDPSIPLGEYAKIHNISYETARRDYMVAGCYEKGKVGRPKKKKD